MKIDDVGAFMEAFLAAVRDDPTILESVISRVAPGGTCFAFGSPDEFETKANAEALALLPQLLDKSFHVRVHRRGFKGRLESHEEERYLGHVLLEAMYAVGQPGVLTFEDPDMIVVAETVSNHASLACWSREDLEGYPFLRID